MLHLDIEATVASMIESTLGPGFDFEDVVATLGADFASIGACGVSTRSMAPADATASAISKLSAREGGFQTASGLVACVRAGTRAKTLAAVIAVSRMLRLKAHEGCAMICGGLIDQVLEDEFEVVLWVR
ncbi:MAG: hypothetical protein RET84_02595 [Pseudomonadota bacterium]|nr:hypothetical protein [Pseudomonadota bacterium]